MPRFAGSTLLRKLSREDYDGAAAKLDRWVYAKGQRLRGLVHRRRAERRLFETPDAAAPLVELQRLDPLPPVRVEPSPTVLHRSLNLRLP